MQINQKEKIVKKIIKLAENCSDPFVLGKRRSRIHSTEDMAFSLIDDYADIFDEISRELLQKERWIEKFSEKYIDEQINKIIIKIIRDENSEKALEYFDQLVTEVEQYSREHIVYVPLFGIELPNGPVKIGNITLKRMNETEVEGLLEKLESIVLGAEGTTESKQKNFEFQRNDINEYIKDKVCAEFRVVAEPGRSLERAEEESQGVIDIFRYAIPALYSSKDKQVVIGLQGEFSRQLRHAIIISTDLDSYHSSLQVVGPIFPFELSSKNLEHMEKIGVFSLGELLEKKQLNPFEKTILQGLTWFSRSQTQIEPKNQLLNLITVLETFLNPRGRNAIVASVADGVAVLLGTDPKQKTKQSDRIRDLYKLRSALSHGGEENILNSNLRFLAVIASKLIMTLIKRKDEFKSQKELIDWIEYTKMGGLSEGWSDYKKFLVDYRRSKKNKSK